MVILFVEEAVETANVAARSGYWSLITFLIIGSLKSKLGDLLSGLLDLVLDLLRLRLPSSLLSRCLSLFDDLCLECLPPDRVEEVDLDLDLLDLERFGSRVVVILRGLIARF